MSVLIKGAEVPKTCQICRTANLYKLLNCEEFVRLSLAERMYKRSDTCPLINIPTPHGDLVDSKRLMEGAIELDWSNLKWINEVAISNATIANTSEE